MSKTLRFLTLLPALLTATLFIANAQQAGLIEEVMVLEAKDAVPAEAVKIGAVKVGDGMRFDCGYEKTLGALKAKAFALEGNIIRITKIKSPDFYSTCYRMWADVYKVTDMDKVKAGAQAAIDSLRQSLIPAGASYALLFVYRPESTYGYAISYNVHVGDSTELRMKNGTGYMLRIPVEGKLNIWTRTERRKELDINVQFGQVYFLRCGINTGAFVGVPDMKLSADMVRAYRDYQLTEHPEARKTGKKKKNNEDDVYRKGGDE